MELDAFLRQPVIQHIGWSLVHFIWQGGLVALLLAMALRLMRNHAPRVRYVPAIMALLLLLALPATTLIRAELGSLEGAAPEREVQSRASLAGVTTDAEIAGLKGGGAWDGPRADLYTSGDLERETGASFGDIRAKLLGQVTAIIQAALPWVVLAWVLGLVVLTLHLLGGAWLLRRWCGAMSEAIPPHWEELANDLAARIGLAKPVRIRAAARPMMPLVTGFLRPTLLVPVGGFPGNSRDGAAAILAHELAHLVRRDALGKLLQILAETLLFYHPAVWWISHQVHQEREQSCDDLAVEVGGDRASYARALADTEERRQAAPRFVLAGSRGPLHRRIHRLLTQPAARSSRSLAGLVGGVGLLSVVFLTLAASVCQMPLASAPYPTTREDYETQVRAALGRMDDGRAMDLACHKPPGGFIGGEWRRDVELSLELDVVMHRRYEEVFVPPANIEQLLPFKWEKASRSLAFGGYGFTQSDGGSRSTYSGSGVAAEMQHLLIEKGEGHFALTIDLDLDGNPELTYDGHQARIADGVVHVVDRGPKGRRAQWLIPVDNADPREEARVILYRDGEFFLVLVDTDGDGYGDCGRSETTVWRPCPKPKEKEKADTEPDEPAHERTAARESSLDRSPEKRKPIAHRDPEITRNWLAFQESVQEAIDAGDDAGVVERLCPMPIFDLKEFDIRLRATATVLPHGASKTNRPKASRKDAASVRTGPKMAPRRQRTCVLPPGLIRPCWWILISMACRN
jgi:beta-lactamase regulating signal transducer with metallopeptidase domain